MLTIHGRRPSGRNGRYSLCRAVANPLRAIGVPCRAKPVFLRALRVISEVALLDAALTREVLGAWRVATLVKDKQLVWAGMRQSDCAAVRFVGIIQTLLRMQASAVH